MQREQVVRKEWPRVIRAVQERIAEADLDAAAVAESLGVHVNVLRQWVHDGGATFGALIQWERASAASDLLSSRRFDGLALKAIGERVGIRSASALTRLLKRHFGEAPIAHRLASIESNPFEDRHHANARDDLN